MSDDQRKRKEQHVAAFRLLIGAVGGLVCGFDINGADCYPLDYLQPLVDAAGNEGCLHHMTLKTNTQGKQE